MSPIDDPEVKELYKIVKLYLDRFEGKKTSSLQPKYCNINPSIIPLNKHLYYSLKRRLELINKYKIYDKEKIIRLIKAAFATSEKISLKELNFLRLVIKHPEYPYYKLAKLMKTSPSTVMNYVRKLEKKLNLRYILLPDYSLFKLRHYSMIFSVDEDNLKRITNQLLTPFTLTINVDTFSQRDILWGWASFIVPDQSDVLGRFKRWVLSIKKQTLYTRLIEIDKLSYGINLDLYDGVRWVFEDAAWSYGLFEFMRRNWEIFKPPTIYEYKKTSIRFDEIDFLLFSFLTKNEKQTLQEMKKNLARNGFDRSISDISKRIKRIKSTGVPTTVTFVGLDLTDLLTIYIECNKKNREILLRSLSYFPVYWLYPHKYGILSFLLMPRGTLFSFIYLIKGIRNEFEDMIIIPRYSHLGGHLDAFEIIKFWDTKKQKWIVPSNIF